MVKFYVEMGISRLRFLDSYFPNIPKSTGNNIQQPPKEPNNKKAEAVKKIQVT